jgi:ribosomal protein S18 acetylase RimI-like enzyme
MPGLGSVRRMEAVGFRSFPSTTTHFDGTWAIRLTAGYPAKRLNSVNPLDPRDHAQLERRIGDARRRFDAYGRPLIFRQSPLAPPELESLFDDEGWERFDESLVLIADVGAMKLAEAVDQVPLKDTGRWVDAVLGLDGKPAEQKGGLYEVISLIQPEVGLFLLQDAGGEPISAVRCVCDGTLAGIFDLATSRQHRRQGHGRQILASALKWASGRGAEMAWLQVVADNQSALSLYEDFGFDELYRYSYRQAPQ